MAGDPAALTRLATEVDGLIRRCSMQSSAPGGPVSTAGPSSPASSSSSEDGGEALVAGVSVRASQPSPPPVLPVAQVGSRGPRRTTRRSAGRQTLMASPTWVVSPTQSTADALSGPSHSRRVSSQSVPGTSQQAVDSESSAEDSLPTPVRTSSGGHRRHKKSAKKRAKRRKADTSSSSSSGLAPVRIWIVGHSIVYWAGIRARQSGRGPDLGFPQHVQVSWISRRGMRWSEFIPLIKRRVLLHGPPLAIVVQLGENDIAKVDCYTLRSTIQRDLGELVTLIPTVKIFWSQLLQRSNWQGISQPKAAERARKRINSAVSKRVTELGGLVIYHPDITFKALALYRNDGVHLSELGNDVWLDAVIEGLKNGLGL
ncbi:uncharacterized protein LOC128406063 [Podarcis raffonei]|uniref:uncharacterized protein LOC128406063 n=1 Tax=Podarcis raffonei TaxID=65483 RepID=UPI0023294596|nr:uncharacterized protein LOC128406063 [Podarcis raffonei]